MSRIKIKMSPGINIVDKGTAYKKGRFYVTFVAKNGRKIQTTETYNQRSAAVNAVKVIKSICLDAQNKGVYKVVKLKDAV